MVTDETNDDPLDRAARAVEQDDQLTAEMAEWDGTIADGLAEDIADSESGEPTFSNAEVFEELQADIEARRKGASSRDEITEVQQNLGRTFTGTPAIWV